MKPSEKIKKISGIVYLVLFMLILLIPLATTERGKDVVSEIDNRTLLEFPTLGEEGFTTDFEESLADRIGLRNEMINAYAVLHDRLLGELTHPTYTYGQEGYVFFNMHNNIEYGEFHKTFAETVSQLQQYCESRGTKFYLLFDPEKISVYREYLPEGVNYDDSWVDTMLDYMEELGVPCINSTSLLREKSQTEAVFNRQYDAGHWNALGCFYATNLLLSRIHQDIPAVQELEKDMFDITTTTVTTLPVSEFRIWEEVPSFRLKSDYANVTAEYADEVSVNPSYPHFHYYINQAEDADTLPKTLMFQGSYYNKNPEFLIRATSEYIGVHNYQNVLELDYYYNIFQPEVVILDVAEYTVSSGYFDYDKMKSLDLNPAILTGDGDFQSQLEALEAQSVEFPLNTPLTVEEGNQVDQVQLDRSFSQGQYGYLIVGEQVFDLRKDEEGKYSASIPHGVLTEGDEVIFYLEEYDGTTLYAPLQVQMVENLAQELTLSAGTTQEEDGFAFATTVEGNTFNSIVLQLYDEASGEYLMAVEQTKGTGSVSGTYLHQLPDGWYRVRLKANSNLADEYADFVVYLIEGQSYRYSYEVDTLTQQSASVSGYQFLGVRSEAPSPPGDP